MASTNKTTNYELSQYIGTDKPTYLSDYNGDMYKIDAQMKVNADNIATAISTANSATTTANNANTTAGQASTSASNAVSTANSASTTATNAQTTANSALATATTAQSSANTALGEIAKFNLTESQDITTFTKTGNGTNLSGNLKLMYDETGSIYKLYGQVDILSNGSNGNITFETDLRPSESITVTGGVIGMVRDKTNHTVYNVNVRSYTIGTNGVVTIGYGFNYNANEAERLIFINSVTFLEQFNDTPVTPE
ncbi:hypothetical protein IKD56_03975 [bacterium]|nr:hypothetical protein [bacterium]